MGSQQRATPSSPMAGAPSLDGGGGMSSFYQNTDPRGPTGMMPDIAGGGLHSGVSQLPQVNNIDAMVNGQPNPDYNPVAAREIYETMPHLREAFGDNTPPPVPGSNFGGTRGVGGDYTPWQDFSSPSGGQPSPGGKGAQGQDIPGQQPQVPTIPVNEFPASGAENSSGGKSAGTQPQFPGGPAPNDIASTISNVTQTPDINPGPPPLIHPSASNLFPGGSPTFPVSGTRATPSTPAPPPGTPPPAAPAPAPAPTAPAPAPGPALPPGIPPGSTQMGSLGLWRTPDGRILDMHNL